MTKLNFSSTSTEHYLIIGFINKTENPGFLTNNTGDAVDNRFCKFDIIMVAEFLDAKPSKRSASGDWN